MFPNTEKVNNVVSSEQEEARGAAESEGQRAARLWMTLTRTEQKVAIGYVEYGMGWRSCVREFGLEGKTDFQWTLGEITRKLGGGDLRRYTGRVSHTIQP